MTEEHDTIHGSRGQVPADFAGLGSMAAIIVLAGLLSYGLSTVAPSEIVWGGNLCSTSGQIATVCGVPPIGAALSLTVSWLVVLRIQRHYDDNGANNDD